MQTFLPYPDFQRTASVLDRQRLGKQRVETMQIMQSFLDPNYRWRNHPAVKMWVGYPWALLKYQHDICHEWSIIRGYKDTCLIKTLNIVRDLPEGVWENTFQIFPNWLGSEKFHMSHQSNLLRKKPEHYSQYFDVSPDLEYYWPKRYNSVTINY